MNSKTISRPQALALRNAEELPEELLRPTDALRGHMVLSARPNTLAALVRLGLAEEVEGQHVLTRAGYTVRAITDLPHYLPRLDTVASIVAAAAEEDAMAAEEQTRPSNGTYYPAEAGARGWRDAVPLWLDGRRVSAIVENDGQDLYVFLGTATIYDGDMPTVITGDGDVNTWVRQYATGYVLAAALETARDLLPEGAQLISAQPVGSGLVIAYAAPGAFYTHAVDAYRPATPDETDPENVDALPVGSLVLADSYGAFGADDVPGMVAMVSRDLPARLAALNS